jgi:hypothetical protein
LAYIAQPQPPIALVLLPTHENKLRTDADRVRYPALPIYDA